MGNIDARRFFVKEIGGKKTVDWAKVRGAMKNFSDEIDTIKGTEESFDIDEVAAAFNRWCTHKIGGTWHAFLRDYVDKETLYQKVREFYNSDVDFAESVEEMYEYDDSELEGNSDPDDQSVPRGIDDWVDKVGATDEIEVSVGSNSGLDVYSDEYGTTDTINMEYEKDFPRNSIIVGDAKEVLLSLPGNICDCIVTSPPYWALREYEGEEGSEWGDGWSGQLGQEPRPGMFVDHLMEIWGVLMRALKPGGSFWLNIDDTYCDGSRTTGRVEKKSLYCVPERLIVEMVENGWILRNKVAWIKQIVDEDDVVSGTALPTPSKDKVREKAWEYLYHFTIDQDYYYDLENISVAHKQETIDAADRDNFGESYVEKGVYGSNALNTSNINEFGANIPNAWVIPIEGTEEDHFAPYPTELCRRPIKATCPDDGVVLDPFTGSGTTLKAASNLGRDYLGIEISEKYARIASRNIGGKVEVTV